MTTYCLDTNYLLRYVVEDVSHQSDEVVKLLEMCLEGKAKCFVTVVAQMEIFYVLSTFYDYNKQKIYDIMNNIYEMQFVTFENLQIMQTALRVYLETSLSIQDAYLVVTSVEKEYELKTFDKKAAKVFGKLK